MAAREWPPACPYHSLQASDLNPGPGRSLCKARVPINGAAQHLHEMSSRSCSHLSQAGRTWTGLNHGGQQIFDTMTDNA